MGVNTGVLLVSFYKVLTKRTALPMRWGEGIKSSGRQDTRFPVAYSLVSEIGWVTLK